MSILNGSTLTLYGYVGDCGIGDEFFTAKNVSVALDEIGSGAVTVNLNSGGGIALEGLAIYNILKNHPGRVTINVDAVAASAASLILMAGDDRNMRDGALIMVHDPSAITLGNAGEHRKSASRLETLSKQVQQIYARCTGLAESEIIDLMAAETWMDADTAIKLGFATSKSDENATAFMVFDYALYHKPPAALATQQRKISMSRTQIENQNEKPWAAKFFASAGEFGLTLATLNSIVEKSETWDVAKDAMIDMLATKDRASKPRFSPGDHRERHESFDNPDFLGKAIGDAIYARMSGRAPEGPAKEWAGRTLLEMGVATLQAKGQRVNWMTGRHGVAAVVMAAGQHSTSDFPNLLQAAGQRFLQDSYQANQTPLKQLARKRVAQDFRPVSLLRLGEAPSLKEVIEGAEVTYGSRAESVEGYRVKTFARIFSISRNALINDDLSAFADAGRMWGQAAAECETAEIVALFSANSGNGGNLSDGQPMYTTGRGNKAAAGGDLGFETLDSGRMAMRLMKGLDGKTPINAAPKFLVVGPVNESKAERIAAAIAPTTSDDVNPFSLKIIPLVEARLNTAAWRLFADPAQLPALEIAYLHGAEGPIVERQEGWTTLGSEFRAVMDIGCGLVEWRASYLNPGA